MKPLIQVRVVQFDGTAAPDVRFSFRPATGTEYQPLEGSYKPGSGVYTFLVDDYRPGLYFLRIEAPGYPVIEKKAEFRDAGYSSEIFLVEEDTECVKMGGRRVYFRRRPRLLGVHIPAHDLEAARAHLDNSPLLKTYLLQDQGERLIFEAPLPETGKEPKTSLIELLRAEFGDALILDQAIETTGGHIEFLSRRIGVELEPGAQWEIVQQELGLENVQMIHHDSELPSFYLVKVDSAEPYAVLEVVTRLLQSPLVKRSEPETEAYTTTASVLPGDLLRPWQWHHNLLRTPEAWGALQASLRFGSADIVLAIHDDGIEVTMAADVVHPDLQGSVAGGTLTGDLGGNGAKVYYQFDFSDPTLIPPGMVQNNVNFRLIPGFGGHGMCVAGVVAAQSDGVTGVVGTAPNVRLASYIFRTIGTQTQLAHAFQFISGFDPGWIPDGVVYPTTQTFPTNFGVGGNAGPGASIINCSHTRPSRPQDKLVEGLRKITLLGRKRRGVIMLVAAANDDADTEITSMWGSYLNLLKIAASTVNHNQQEILAPYSNHATAIDPAIDVCAPSGSNTDNVNNPPLFHGVVTDQKKGAGNTAGTIAAQAVIQGDPALGETLQLLPADFPNFPPNTNVIILDPANHETIEANRLVAPPPGAPANTVYLKTPLDTDFPADSLIIRGADDYTDAFSGTSASTPMVSGVVALMLSANPALTWSEVRQILRDTAVPIALRYLGPNGSRDKDWVDDTAAPLMDNDGVMLIPSGAPTRIITTALTKTDHPKIINVANANDFKPRQAICIGAESKLSAPTTTTGLMANKITVDRGADFELDDIIYIGKKYETVLDRPEAAVPGGASGGTSLTIRVADPDGFVVGDTLDVGGQRVKLTAVRYRDIPSSSSNSRVLFDVMTFGTAGFAAAPLGTIVKIAATELESFTITDKAGNLLTLNANVANVHPAGRIVQKEGTEIASVKRVVSPSSIEVYQLINDHNVTNPPRNLHITGGPIAFYSHGFGYGRVDAYEAVIAAINYTHNDRDLMIRNFMGDDGVTNRAAKRVHSPDLWVTNDSPTSPGLTYDREGPHQQPRVSISAPVFVGSGLNDLSAQGVFGGAAVSTYVIEIVTAGAIDKFTWRKEGSAASAPMDITAAPQDIDVDGFLFVTFGAVTGHGVGDKWYIRCEKITNRHVQLRLRNRGTLTTFAASSLAAVMTTPVNQYRIFLCLSDGTPVVQYRPPVAGGLNDLSVVSPYTGGTKDIITIKITATGAADSFKWSIGSGTFNGPIVITGTAQAVTHGVSIKFGAVTGHTLNATWVLKCYPEAQKFINIDHFILSNPAVPFSLTADRPGTWLMDEQKFPVLAAGESRYHSFPWPENNRPPRNGFGVVQPDRPLRMFILGEVVPHDGKLMGDVPQEDNNFSYREIIFARFGFKKRSLKEEITSYVGVDSLGTVTNEDFSVQVIADVSSFNAEAVKLEFLLEFVNGATEAKAFEFNGGAWGFAGAAPDWCTMDGSPKQANGATNATDEQYYMTFSGTLNVKSQHKSIQITPKIYSTVDEGVILAEETRNVAVMEEAGLASGRYSGVSPADLAPRSHFFADQAAVLPQTDAIAYGPVVTGTPADRENKFRITSLFKATTATADVHAYSIVDGFVMLQRVADAANPGTYLTQVVNLFIKPYTQAIFGFTPVKYFIYRNLRLDEFLKGDSAADEKLIRAEAGASPFIQSIWAVHTAQNGSAPFESLVLGFDPANQPGTDKIDKLFHRQDPNKQLFPVTRGVNLGKFYTNAGVDEFGLEIVLDEGGFQPTYDYARQYKEVVIDVSAMPTGTDQEEFTVRFERERILNYIDPAAFFGMHMSKGGWLEVDDGTGNKTKLPGVDVYDNVITKFYTKNTLYVDVRNEDGRSLNFSGQYDDGSGNALELGDTSASLAAQAYASDKWPLIIRPSSSAANAQDYNLVFLRLRRDYNHKPILYLEHGRPDGKTTKGRFIADEDLIAALSPQTNILGFRFPNRDLGSGGNRVGVAWMLKMDYMTRQEEATSALRTASALAASTTDTPFYLDNIFGPIDAEPSWKVDSPVIAWVPAKSSKFVDGDGLAALGFEHLVDRGVAFSQWTGASSTAGSVLFYAAAKDVFVNDSAKFVGSKGITEGVSKRNSFFEEPLLFDGYSLGVNVIKDGATEVITMSLQQSDPEADPQPAEAMLLAGLTRNELETQLKPLTGFDTRFPRTLLFEEVPDSPFIDPSGQFYRKFKTGLRGLDNTGTVLEVFPATDVIVYTSDQKFLFSSAFTQAEPLSTSYGRNYEELFGAKSRTGEVYEISAIAGTDVTVDLKPSGGEPPVDLTREILPGDQVTLKSVVYNVSSVSATTASSGVLTLGSAPPGVLPGTDRLYAPAKPFEDYYIAKDRLGSLPGSPEPMETLVGLFVSNVNGVLDNSSAPAAIQTHINNYGPRILERARLICGHDGFSYPDDRILYWARIKMMVKMKSHPYLCRVLTERNRLVALFETVSRGYDAVTFGAAGSNKKVLLLGFDPFQIDSNRKRSNPSGAAVLALHGLTATNIYVQTAILPVRYADFQRNALPNEGTGVVEQVVERLLNDPNNVPDMIVTVSQTLGFQFDLDRFASRRRSEFSDNVNVGKVPFPKAAEGKQFYETTLPETKIVPPNNISGIFKVFYNNFFWYQWHRTESELEDSYYPFDYVDKPDQPSRDPSQPNSGTKKIEDSTHPEHLLLRGLVPSALTDSSTPKEADIIAKKGSGGSYLSNESFYRVARLREMHAPSLLTGHYHVPKIQHDDDGTGTTYSAVDNSTTSTKDLNPPVLKKLIEEVRDALVRAFS